MASPGNQPNEINLQVTLDQISQKLEKLEGLDRIENKIDNLHNRVESLETRISAVENDHDDFTGNIVSLRADLAVVQTAVSKLKSAPTSQLQSRVEYLENRDRSKNLKVLNLPTVPNESIELLQSRVINIFQHVIPGLPASHVLKVVRLKSRSGVTSTQQPLRSAVNQTFRDNEGAERGGAPVLVTVSSEDLVHKLLKDGDKKLKTYAQGTYKVVDDISQFTQEKRKLLIEKRDSLRRDGLVAIIPFTKTAKLIYKQGDKWHTIFPENL